MLLEKIQRRLDAKSEKGFTLIELLVVIIIIGILLAIAVPSYLGFRERAADSAAQANVRAAIPAIEAYAADNDGYLGVDRAALLAVDAGLSPDLVIAGADGAAGTAPTATTFCISVDAFSYQVPGGVIAEAACP